MLRLGKKFSQRVWGRSRGRNGVRLVGSIVDVPVPSKAIAKMDTAAELGHWNRLKSAALSVDVDSVDPVVFGDALNRIVAGSDGLKGVEARASALRLVDCLIEACGVAPPDRYDGVVGEDARKIASKVQEAARSLKTATMLSLLRTCADPRGLSVRRGRYLFDLWLLNAGLCPRSWLVGSGGSGWQMFSLQGEGSWFVGQPRHEVAQYCVGDRVEVSKEVFVSAAQLFSRAGDPRAVLSVSAASVEAGTGCDVSLGRLCVSAAASRVSWDVLRATLRHLAALGPNTLAPAGEGSHWREDVRPSVTAGLACLSAASPYIEGARILLAPVILDAALEESQDICGAPDEDGNLLKHWLNEEEEKSGDRVFSNGETPKSIFFSGGGDETPKSIFSGGGDETPKSIFFSGGVDETPKSIISRGGGEIPVRDEKEGLGLLRDVRFCDSETVVGSLGSVPGVTEVADRCRDAEAFTWTRLSWFRRKSVAEDGEGWRDVGGMGRVSLGEWRAVLRLCRATGDVDGAIGVARAVVGRAHLRHLGPGMRLGGQGLHSILSLAALTCAEQGRMADAVAIASQLDDIVSAGRYPPTHEKHRPQPPHPRASTRTLLPALTPLFRTFPDLEAGETLLRRAIADPLLRSEDVAFSGRGGEGGEGGDSQTTTATTTFSGDTHQKTSFSNNPQKTSFSGDSSPSLQAVQLLASTLVGLSVQHGDLARAVRILRAMDAARLSPDPHDVVDPAIATMLATGRTREAAALATTAATQRWVPSAHTLSLFATVLLRSANVTEFRPVLASLLKLADPDIDTPVAPGTETSWENILENAKLRHGQPVPIPVRAAWRLATFLEGPELDAKLREPQL